MCESNAFLVRGDEEELVLEEVTFMEPVEGGYRLRNLFGEETVVSGRLQEVNLIKHKIVFRDE
ncbi:MAG: CooT family nickel-binding protein [Deltaproteobacteria bacterium]|nr:CooT family nickel-binding protein [Deltaproteobacteria bacterium]